MLDTIQNALNTPNKNQPFAQLGLKEDEYQKIKEILGRRPTDCELAMYSVMWSEHCSYKSSKKHIQEQFVDKTTPQMREKLLVGIGENAGVVDIGQDMAVTFKIESHNHPSFVEPYQGAATGVGGIVRDIIAMGARPIAVGDQLAFGQIQNPDTARVLHGVVSGIGFYGNCLGLPNIGGQTVFDASYQGNPLVNALCVGIMNVKDIKLGAASGVGNLVVMFGSRTGGDGIGGASVLASATFEKGGPSKRPSVQVGDPFQEKLLIESCLEMYKENLVLGISDFGAAGLSCATSELSASGNCGMEIDLDKVLLRDNTLTPEEILMSESQERMMAIIEPKKLKKFAKLAYKWSIEYSVVGKVVDGNLLKIYYQNEKVVEVDPKTVAKQSPVYNRPYKKPEWQDALNEQKTTQKSVSLPSNEMLLKILASPNVCSKDWITNQYDRFVRGNTVLSFPHNAGVIRIKDNLGIAISTDGSHRYSKLDPYKGAQLAISEAYRNVSCSGAVPLAVTDCLNFGSPESTDSMWQLVQAMKGLSSACIHFQIPITGGNVSLYNETGKAGNIDSAINPMPMVGVLGKISDINFAHKTYWNNKKQNHLYLLGPTHSEFGGSVYQEVIENDLNGIPPEPRLESETLLSQILNNLTTNMVIQNGISAVKSVNEGGVLVALAQMCILSNSGASISLPFNQKLLFSESQARAIIAVDSSVEFEQAFEEILDKYNYEYSLLGTTGGENLSIEDTNIDLSVNELSLAYNQTLDKFF